MTVLDKSKSLSKPAKTKAKEVSISIEQRGAVKSIPAVTEADSRLYARQVLIGHMATMRKEGHTLQSIGDTFGITRERVRQILNKHYPGLNLAVHKFCIRCGKPTKVAMKYCPECSKAYKRYSYPFFTPEAKKRHIEHTTAWRERNPEKVREIYKRVSVRYLERRKRRHYAETTYIVTKRNGALPIGTQFKAVGCVHSHLALEGGSTIPNLCVKKLY